MTKDEKKYIIERIKTYAKESDRFYHKFAEANNNKQYKQAMEYNEIRQLNFYSWSSLYALAQWLNINENVLAIPNTIFEK